MLRYARAFRNAFEGDNDSISDRSSVGRRSESRMSTMSRNSTRVKKEDELKGRLMYQSRRQVVSKLGESPYTLGAVSATKKPEKPWKVNANNKHFQEESARKKFTDDLMADVRASHEKTILLKKHLNRAEVN